MKHIGVGILLVMLGPFRRIWERAHTLGSGFADCCSSTERIAAAEPGDLESASR